MIELRCTNCDEGVVLKTFIRPDGDMIVECMGCGDIKKFQCVKQEKAE